MIFVIQAPKLYDVSSWDTLPSDMARIFFWVSQINWFTLYIPTFKFKKTILYYLEYIVLLILNIKLK